MITEGETYKTALRHSQADVIAFAQVSGDDNPLHLDPEFAAQSVFKRPIMHGFLSGSVFSKVFGTQWPGKGSIYLSQTLEFKRPMFVDTDYEALFTIKSVNAEKHSAVIATQITEAATGKVTLNGEAVIMNTETF